MDRLYDGVERRRRAVIETARAHYRYISVLYISLPSLAAAAAAAVSTHSGHTEIAVQLLDHKRPTLKEVMRPANKSTVVNDTRTAASKKH